MPRRDHCVCLRRTPTGLRHRSMSAGSGQPRSWRRFRRGPTIPPRDRLQTLPRCHRRARRTGRRGPAPPSRYRSCRAGRVGGGQALEVGTGAAGQHFIPCLRTPFRPLTFRQSHGDRAWLEDHELSPLPGGPPLHEPSDGDSQVVGGEVAPKCGNLAELTASRLFQSDEAKRGKKRRRFAQEIRLLPRCAPKNEGVD